MSVKFKFVTYPQDNPLTHSSTVHANFFILTFHETRHIYIYRHSVGIIQINTLIYHEFKLNKLSLASKGPRNS